MSNQNSNHVASFTHVTNGARNLFFRDRIQRRSRLVKHQQPRLAQQRPGNREPLLLSARNLHAAFANQRIQSFAARASSESAAALCNTSKHSSSVAFGRTNSRFSRIVPENSCVSCVTKPICARNSSASISAAFSPLYRTVPSSAHKAQPTISPALSSPPPKVPQTQSCRRSANENPRRIPPAGSPNCAGTSLG